MSSSDKIQLPDPHREIGAFHPINQTKDHIISLLKDFGFIEVYGPEIETEEFNFDMLNIKKSHPARQMHDTFYINKKRNFLELIHLLYK